MGKLKMMAQFIKSNDIFSSTEYLRLNRKSKFGTLEGGLLSMAIFIILAIMAGSMISTTLDRSIIASKVTIYHQEDDSSKIEMKLDKFMFGVRLATLGQKTFDLNNDLRYFDFTLSQITFSNGNIANISFNQLQQCTQAHWSAFPSILQRFDELKISKWLCPSLNNIIALSGSYMSHQSQNLMLKVLPCTNSSNTSNACHPQSEIDLLFADNINLILNIFFTSPILNLQDSNFIDYQLNVDGLFSIGKQLGGLASVLLSDFVIQTDNSIWPISDINQREGLMIDGNIAYRSAKFSQSDGYLRFFFNKSQSSYSFYREVQKLSSVFAFVGGYFGIFYSLLAFLKIYTDKFYMTAMVEKIYHLEKESDIGKFCENFNFFKFIYMTFGQFANWISMKDCCGWPKGFLELKQELEVQLDVSLLIKRIIKLQKMMSYLIPREKLPLCYNKKQLRLQCMIALREKFGNTEDSQNFDQIQELRVNSQKQQCISSIQKKITRKIALKCRVNEISTIQIEDISSMSDDLSEKQNYIPKVHNLKNRRPLQSKETLRIDRDKNLKIIDIKSQFSNGKHQSDLRLHNEVPCQFIDT